MPDTQIAYHPFIGGLDLVSPVLNIPVGYLLDGINYEPDVNGGYRRIPGYERFDGQVSPSNRQHTVLQVDQSGLFQVGDTLTGQESQSTGTVVIVDKFLVLLCEVNGRFTDGEELSNGEYSAVITSLDYTEDSFTKLNQYQRWERIEGYYRQKITPPTGTKGIEGVCHHYGTTYAFRANDDDKIIISQSTPQGWVEIPQQSYLKFEKAGELIPEEGASFTTTNGASATVQRYIRQGGSIDDLSVNGYFMLDNITGTFADGDRLEVGRQGAGKVASSGYLTMTVANIELQAILPALGGKIKNQSDGQATVHEAILRQAGATADVVNCWFVLSNVIGTFADGDQISLVDKPAMRKSARSNDFWIPVDAQADKDINIFNPDINSFGGITVTTGQRLLLNDQTNKIQNGIYTFNGQHSPLTRCMDAVRPSDFVPNKTIQSMTSQITGVLSKIYAYSGKENPIIDHDEIDFLLKENVVEGVSSSTATANNPFGNIQGQPLPAIEIKAHTELPELGSILEMAGKEARVYWSTTFTEEIKDRTPERVYLVLQDLSEAPTADTVINEILIAGYAKGLPTPIELKAGGVFEFVAYNFFARTEQIRIYGCNGKDFAFELNPKTGLICPILMDDDPALYPHTLAVHKNHLFLGFDGGLVRHSVIGEPMNFNGQLGAFEIGVGDDVSAMVSHPGDVLAIVCKNRIQGLYGNTIDDWNMSLIAENVGGYPRSVQLLQQAYMLDDNGLCQLQRVMEYGNFQDATVSRLIQPLINRHKKNVTGSTVLRDQNLICLYFNNGFGLSFRPIPEQLPEILNFEYPTNITCVHHFEDEAGNARVFFGTPEGWVFEDRKGSSFDGQPIESLIRTAYNPVESPTYRKSFKRLELMLAGGYDVFLQLGMEFDYSAAYTPQSAIRAFTLYGGQGGYWNEDNWNEFYWSGQDVSTGEISVSGTGKNYSLMIYGKSPWTSPYTLQGVMVHYIPRRLDRG